MDPFDELLLGAPRTEVILFVQGNGHRTRIIIHSIPNARLVIIIIVIKAEFVAWTFVACGPFENCCSVRHE